MNKKAQLWGTDLFIAAIIFSIAMTLFYLYAINSGGEAEETIQTLSYEGGIITENLLSEGYPQNWNTTNVIQPGILSQGKINQTKLEYLRMLSLSNYEALKTKLNTPYDFYFFLDEPLTIQGVEVDGIGKPGATRVSINSENLIKISRITIYQDKIMGANLYLWT